MSEEPLINASYDVSDPILYWREEYVQGNITLEEFEAEVEELLEL